MDTLIRIVEGESVRAGGEPHMHEWCRAELRRPFADVGPGIGIEGQEADAILWW